MWVNAFSWTWSGIYRDAKVCAKLQEDAENVKNSLKISEKNDLTCLMEILAKMKVKPEKM